MSAEREPGPYEPPPERPDGTGEIEIERPEIERPPETK